MIRLLWFDERDIQSSGIVAPRKCSSGLFIYFRKARAARGAIGDPQSPGMRPTKRTPLRIDPLRLRNRSHTHQSLNSATDPFPPPSSLIIYIIAVIPLAPPSLGGDHNASPELLVGTSVSTKGAVRMRRGSEVDVTTMIIHRIVKDHYFQLTRVV